MVEANELLRGQERSVQVISSPTLLMLSTEGNFSQEKVIESSPRHACADPNMVTYNIQACCYKAITCDRFYDAYWFDVVSSLTGFGLERCNRSCEPSPLQTAGQAAHPRFAVAQPKAPEHSVDCQMAAGSLSAYPCHTAGKSRSLLASRCQMAMGQNPEPPVNIPIPTKID